MGGSSVCTDVSCSGECSISCLVYSSRMVFYEYLRDHVFGKNKDGSFDVW